MKQIPIKLLTQFQLLIKLEKISIIINYSINLDVHDIINRI